MSKKENKIRGGFSTGRIKLKMAWAGLEAWAIEGWSDRGFYKDNKNENIY